MAHGFIKTGGLTRETILKIAAIGVLTIVAGTSPYFLHKVVGAYFHDRSKKAARAHARKLRELEKYKLIAFRELGNGTVRIELTHQGKHLVRQYNLEDMKLKKPKRWDRKWRIVIYDIPTHQKQASNAFREKLKGLGLFPLQKSVWVYPYECFPEIEFMATVFDIDINHCISCFTTTDVPRKKEMTKFFDL